LMIYNTFIIDARAVFKSNKMIPDQHLLRPTYMLILVPELDNVGKLAYVEEANTWVS
jgi:hypothetical protein